MTIPGVSDATGRIVLRRRRGRRRRVIAIAVLAGVLAVLGVLAWLVLGSSVLGVRAVVVQGGALAGADQVRALAAIPDGTPLAQVDLDAVAARVSGLAPVAKVAVSRQWPNTIDIAITERVPALAVETPGGYWIADDTGVIFNSAAQPPRNLMVARVPGGDPRLIRDLAAVTRALPASLRSTVQLIGADTPDSITLELSGGARVVWGGAEQSELKAQVLARLLPGKHRVYDVSAPSNPTTR
ncbi:MAG: FtsQ-type POTRA domain-containing protein [Micropruina sp.]|uniref:cell division protein FtsQ/DivIB n=1 Tax=Micropruina sp. TaxID=2737536 RepID=UPI0039E4C814